MRFRQSLPKNVLSEAILFLLLIIAVLLFTMIYMFLNNWWYQNVMVPRILQEKSRASSVLMNGGSLSPMDTVETRQLPPGMYVHGLS